MTARSELERELRGPVTALGALSEEEAADLLQLFQHARRQEAEAMAASNEAVTESLPRPVRGLARKILFGDSVGR